MEKSRGKETKGKKCWRREGRGKKAGVERGCLQNSFFRDPKNGDVENKKHKMFYNKGWEDIQK